MMTGSLFFEYAGRTALGLLMAAMALALWRLARGPAAADRVVALDLLSVLVVAFLVAVSTITGESSYLDVAIAYACIAFLGTVALARFIVRAAQRRADVAQGENNHD